METITEYGCAHCGGKLLKPALTPLNDYNPSTRSATTCSDCGCETVASNLRGFQCSSEIHSLLHECCTRDELKQLRRDPKDFLAALNTKLIASDLQELEVDTTTKPPIIREKL